MPWYDPAVLAFRTLVGVTHWTNFVYHNTRFLRGRIIWQFPAQALLPGITGHGGLGPTGPKPHDTAAWIRDFDAVYPKDVDRVAFQKFALPGNFVGNGAGNVNVKVFVYFIARSGTGAVRWRARLKAVAEGEAWDTATGWDAEGACTCSVESTVGRLGMAEFTVTVAGLTAKDLVALEIARVGSHADDNMQANAELIYCQGEAG